MRQADNIFDAADAVIAEAKCRQLLLALKQRNMRQVAAAQIDYLRLLQALARSTVDNEDALNLWQLDIQALVVRVKRMHDAVLQEVAVPLVGLFLRKLAYDGRIRHLKVLALHIRQFIQTFARKFRVSH